MADQGTNGEQQDQDTQPVDPEQSPVYMDSDSRANKRQRGPFQFTSTRQSVSEDFMTQVENRLDKRLKAIADSVANTNSTLTNLIKPLSERIDKHSDILTQHESQLSSLLALDADSKWRREKQCNVKYSVDRSSPLTELILTPGLSRADRDEKIQKLCQWLTSNTKVNPLPIGHAIIDPKSQYWSPFYVIRYSSEAHADMARSQYQLFLSNKIYATYDLTPLEQQRKREIIQLLKAHWRVEKIQNGRFVRDCIKCCLDQDSRMVVANLEQVVCPKKPVARAALRMDLGIAFSMLKRYAPNNQQYWDLKLNHSWSDIQCFQFLADCIDACKAISRVPRLQYNQDIQQDLVSSGLLSSKFRVYYQNIAGIFNNYFGVMKLLDSQQFSVIALNETQCPALSSDLHSCSKRNGYIQIELHGRRFASVGRYCGGTVIFIKKHFVITEVVKDYHDWGESVSFTLNTHFTFHCIYRNPNKSKLADITHMFTDLFNTSQYHMYFGDFNSELLAPPTRLRLKYKPILLSQCKHRTPSMTDGRFDLATRNMKCLAPFPLSVLSTFSPTSAANRCIDFGLVNSVAANCLPSLKCLVQRGDNILLSDHRYFQFGFDMDASSLALPTYVHNTNTTLRIGKRAIKNNCVALNAMTYLFQLLQFYSWHSFSSSLALAWLSTLTFISFKTSQAQFRQAFPSQKPTYAVLYRRFRQIVTKVPALSEQRRILKQQRWKYNVLQGCSMTRSLMKTNFMHFSFQTALKRCKADQIVTCQPTAITTYFQNFFAGQFSQQAQVLDDDFFNDYSVLPTDMINELSASITLPELRSAVSTMNNNSTPGTFGLELECIKLLLDNDQLGGMIVDILNGWVLEEFNTDLFVSLISAIPKPKKPPDQPENLRPIAVTSLWYRVVSKLFAVRLSPYLHTIYSQNQHGFCPGRNVLTALCNVKLCTEISLSRQQQLYLLQCDISKAYDNVDRDRLHSVMEFIGIARIPLYQFVDRAMRLGQVQIVTQTGLSDPFTSFRGIRQGCPVSPILFSILISGLERRLLRKHASLGIQLHGESRVLSSYADDIKLMSCSAYDLNILFLETQHYLAQLGLVCKAADCSLMIIDGAQDTLVPIGDSTLKSVSSLKFLGVIITNQGLFLPKDVNTSRLLWDYFNRIKKLGLSSYPQAFVRAYSTFVSPSVLFGIEIWGAEHVKRVLVDGESPFLHDRFTPAISVFKQWLGLSYKAFNAPLYKLLGIKPPFVQAYQQIVKLIKSMPQHVWEQVAWVAEQVPGGYAAILVELRAFHEGSSEDVSGSVPIHVERVYWEGHEHNIHSRHRMFFQVFGAGPLGFNCIRSKSSFSTLRTIARFLCLSYPYFYNSEEEGETCPLCNSGVRGLLHLLTECEATTCACVRHGVPQHSIFLRQYLVSLQGTAFAKLINDLKSIISDPHRTLTPRASLRDHDPRWPHNRLLVVRFDGSFSTVSGAGIGVTINIEHPHQLLVQASVPVRTQDAQRTEMMGACLGGLIASTIGGKYMLFEGDSSYVCGLLDGTYTPRESFFYNCVEIIRDCTSNKHFTAQWIPRDNNSVCDGLARQAVSTKVSNIQIEGVEGVNVEVINQLVREFVSTFVA